MGSKQKPIMHQKMYVKALALYLLAWIADAYHQPMNLSDMKPDGGSGPSIFLPVTGNVYPLGYYTVTISIGNPPKYSFVLDVDTGSDLTWVPCADGNPSINPRYNPNAKGTKVTCGDDACIALGDLGDVNMGCPANEQCEYSIDYADGGSSDGVLVRDSIPLTFRNGTIVSPQLAFGCGISGDDEGRNHKNIVGGVLGLGKGKPGILHQLSKMSVIRNAVGHCFSGQGQGGGYLFFGDLPILGVAWKQILSDEGLLFREHYYLGSADILLGGEPTDIKGRGIIFDSGSTFTYLDSEAYGALLDLVTKNLNGKLSDAVGETSLPVCWQGPFQTIGDVAGYFKTVTLNFTDENKVIEFEMPPESYLIITEMHNLCLGILNGTEVGLEDMNLIGDISMQNKLVIYDNENGVVGWAAVDTCNKNF